MENFIEIYDDYIKVREATKQGYAIAVGGDSINLEQPNSKTRRGRVGKGIANTLTCSCNQGVVIEMNKGFVNKKYEEFYGKHGYIPEMFNPYNTSEIKDFTPTITTQCGSTTSSSTVLIKEGNKIIKTIIPQQVRIRNQEVDIDNLKILLREGKDMNEIEVLGNYSLSNHSASRIVSIDGITPTVMENHGTVTAILENKYIGGRNMWENNLERFNFKMEEIRVFDIFAGIGSLHKSLKKLGVPVRITNLSEVDIDAIISYGAIHIENFKDLEFEFPSVEEMRSWLIERNIGYDFEKNKSKVIRLNGEKLKLLYKASYLLNNLGDVSKIDPKDIEDFDLMNLSFCCQDISNAGQQKGLRNEDGTPTRSGLIVPSLKLARAKKPKYIMIENVKALIQKKFIDDFYDIVNELEEIGYNCYYPTKEDKKRNKSPMCLNSKDFGIPQNRERIYVICVRKDIDNGTFEFPTGRDFGIRLKDLLEDKVDEKYYLSPEVQNKISNWNAYQRPFQNVLGENSTSPTITARGAGEYHSGMVLIGDGLEDKTNLEDNNRICEQRSDEGLRFFKDNVCGTLRTIDACGDKRVWEDDNNEIKIRKLTPRECWRLMGFSDDDFNKAQELGVFDSQLYKQAGNSIVVNVLYYIFKNLFKEYIIEN